MLLCGTDDRIKAWLSTCFLAHEMSRFHERETKYDVAWKRASLVSNSSVSGENHATGLFMISEHCPVLSVNNQLPQKS